MKRIAFVAALAFALATGIGAVSGFVPTPQAMAGPCDNGNC
jgi:hypothetical protein